MSRLYLQCYKHVVVLLEKQFRRLSAAPGSSRGKLHLLYSVSSLLRLSRKTQGAKDRYGEPGREAGRAQASFGALTRPSRPHTHAWPDHTLPPPRLTAFPPS